MSALSAGRATPEWEFLAAQRSYPMDALAQIWEGGLVALDSTGYAVAASSGSTLTMVGVAQESKLAGAVDGDTNISVHQGTFRLAADSAFAQTTVGGACYAVDDQTVSTTSTNRSLAGIVAAVDGSNVWVTVGLSPPNEDAALTAFEATLATTGNAAAGAILVGIADTGSLITATTVEAALAELVKIANAGNSKPMVIPVFLTGCISGSTVFTFKPTFDGKIDRIDGSTRTLASTGSKDATIGVKISGVAVTSASLALTTVKCSAVGIFATGAAATANNAFLAGDTITVYCSANPTATFAEGEEDILLFIKSA